METFTLELLGGDKGLLVNSTNLCQGTHRANAIFSAQNGKRIVLHPALQNSCKKTAKKKGKAQHTSATAGAARLRAAHPTTRTPIK